jgi:hypothetical protein
MADTSKIAEMLEHLVNNDQAKAEELFHEYVVAKSRDIYEGLIESELDEETDEETNEDQSDDVEESFEDIDEADETDDFGDDVAASDEEGEEEGGEEEGGEEFGADEEEGNEEDEATKGDILDLKDAIDELQSAFDQFVAGEEQEPEHGGDDMGMGMGDEEEMGMGDSFAQTGDLSTVREYVEKVGDGHGAEKKGAAEKADSTKSPVAGKNDMGGTTANILSSKEDTPAYAGAGGTIKGNGLTKQKPQDMNTGNINKVGGTKTSSVFSKNGAGHGAEKAGAKENASNTASLFRGK